MVNNKKKKKGKKKKATSAAPSSNKTEKASSNKTDGISSQSITDDLMPKMLSALRKPPAYGDHIIFTGKIRGACARLFAAGCLHYLEAAASACNDTPESLPVWSSLSPQQRIHLVKEVMVGLLCEDEPIPQTEQHFLAYMGIWKTIDVELSVELDMESDSFFECEEYEERLTAILDSFPPDIKLPSNDNSRKETEEEKAERLRKAAIRSKIASRNKKKLAKKMEKCDKEKDECQVNRHEGNKEKEDEESSGPDGFDPKMDVVTNLLMRHESVFYGGPPPLSSRSHLKPDLNTEKELYWKFQWRILCDDAFQEQNEPTMWCPLPLKYLNFNWKLNDNSYDSKWFKATLILFLESGFINYNAVVHMVELHLGRIDDEEYANPKHHHRIINIRKLAKEWRAPYDESYEANQYYSDQRCIFSICSAEAFGETSHEAWLLRFLDQCLKHKVVFKKGGNYQKRFEIYCMLEDHDTKNICSPFMDEGGLGHPSQYEADIDYGGFWYEHCHAEMCFSGRKELSKCASCKVVKYCSRECQKKDWPRHKKDCKALAAMNKDKSQLLKISKE